MDARERLLKEKIALLDIEREKLLRDLQNLEQDSVVLNNKNINQTQQLEVKESTSRYIPNFYSDENIKLFRSLFRGREDLYARFWISKKTGKSGYTPVCKNEWVPNICQKPIVKCSECSNRELLSLLDDNCNPYVNQWEFLSNLEKMSFSEIGKISEEASTSGQIIGVKMSPIDEDNLPWMRLPSGKKKYKPVINNLPKEIELIVSNRIYIKVDVLPSVLFNQIKRLAAFQNPEFYRRQNMRLSTSLTPRVICCSEILDGYLSIPRGCFDDLHCLMNEYGIGAIIRDERIVGKKTNFKFYGLLNNEQKIVVKKILKKEIGVFVSPPGTGKTVLAIYSITKRKTNTLVLVHRKLLVEQWRMQLSLFLNIDLKDIGQIGGGKNNPNGFLDVAMIQSMERKGIVDDRIADYGFIIVDECHHVSAVSFERVLSQAKAKYILGLTATCYRRDGHQPIIHMQCGPISHSVKSKDIKQEISNFIAIPRMTKFICEWTEKSNIHDVWAKMINDEQRDKIIVDDIIKVVQSGRFPIILTERREHLEILADKLQSEIKHLVILYGGLKPKNRKEMLEELSKCSNDETKAILATGTYIGEGFDDPRLDTLFITMPISFKGRIVQYAGRLHRKYQSKKEVQVYDYVDAEMPVLWKMYQRRLKTYKIMGYKIQEDTIAEGDLQIWRRI